MTEEAMTKSGEPTACFPGDLSKISTPVIVNKETTMSYTKKFPQQYH